MSSNRTVIVAVTRAGARLAVRLAPDLRALAVVPQKFAAEAVEHMAYAGSVPEALAVVPQKFAAEAVEHMAYAGSVLEVVRDHWEQAAALVLVMASGIAVRAVAPLLGHKSSDPAVVCLDEAGRFVVPLLGGHQAGANTLAQRIAALTAGQAAVTTASDSQGLPALDRLGAQLGWRVDPASALTHTLACLVNGEPLGCYVDPALPGLRRQLESWLAECPDLRFVAAPAELLDERFAAGLLISPQRLEGLWPALRMKTVRYLAPWLVAGLGCRRGVPAEELQAALRATLDAADLDSRCLAALATAELKADETGLLALAAGLGLPLEVVPNQRLAALDPASFSPSAATARFELPGVAEPCALLTADGPLLVPKRAFERCTVAVALQTKPPAESCAASDPGGEEQPGQNSPAAESCAASDPGGEEQPGQNSPAAESSLASGLRDAQQPGASSGLLCLIGIGPGDLRQLTTAAREALQAAEIVTGYRVYVDLVRPLLSPEQELIVTPAMGDELGRARQAIELAAAGRRVALISSGDIGIYAMAGPVFEQLREAGWAGHSPEVEVLPGISAFQAVAARLGAPICHDFCLISLSDLLTPWPLIERRIAAAAQADFVVAFYNPRSRERHWQLGTALAILREQRPPTTPVAFARNITRADEQVTLTTLAEADPAQVDMFTLVLVGNSRSYLTGGRMATPRGYEVKLRESAAQPDPAALPKQPASFYSPEPLVAGAQSEPPGEGDPASLPVAGAQFAVPGEGDLASLPVEGYPVVLSGLAGALAVVVGGGVVGERKVRGLLAAGLRVRLVSPAATPQLGTWAAEGRIMWQRRGYQAGDLDGARLVFAATDQRRVNAAVAQAAAAAGLLCNVADLPAEGSFHLPALHRQHGMIVAVSSGGRSPAGAAALRNQIARWLEASVGESNNER